MAVFPLGIQTQVMERSRHGFVSVCVCVYVCTLFMDTNSTVWITFIFQKMSYDSHNQILQQETLCDTEKKRVSY